MDSGLWNPCSTFVVKFNKFNGDLYCTEYFFLLHNINYKAIFFPPK